ncbi:MAG: hypothetical protein JW763_04075 [candidate division Zixibacteria bacterium]|nr:hypothetical protein [candidate division Zixibacteria bacterium]
MKRFNYAMIDRGDRKKYIFAVRHSIWHLLFVLTLCVGTADGDDFTVLGVTFPTLNDSLHHCLLTGDTIYYVRHPKSVEVYFHLNTAGCVDSLTYDTVRGGDHVRALVSSLSCLDFNPARIDGKPISFVLPSLAVFGSKAGHPDLNLVFPVNGETGEKTGDLVHDALVRNNITPPGIVRFPSYFCRCDKMGESGGYHYVVFQLDIDSSGGVTDYEMLATGSRALADMLGTVLQYAEYSPAIRQGQVMASRCYLVVRLFSELHYPTAIWPPADPSSLLFENYRLQISLYLDSIPLPPVPINLPDGMLNSDHILPANNAMSVRIGIDTLGQVDYVRPASALPGVVYSDLRNTLRRLHFYPARDIHGRPVYYNGELELDTNNSEKIRIIARWLPRTVYR